jgi:hypothetical protein
MSERRRHVTLRRVAELAAGQSDPVLASWGSSVIEAIVFGDEDDLRRATFGHWRELVDARHDWLRSAAAKLPDGSPNWRGARLHEKLLRYRASAWKFDREKPSCPDTHHPNSIEYDLWHILAIDERVPAAGYLGKLFAKGALALANDDDQSDS